MPLVQLVSHTYPGGTVFFLCLFTAVSGVGVFRQSGNALLMPRPDDCITKVVLHHFQPTFIDYACSDVPIPELCNNNHKHTISNQWMMSVQADCKIVYNAVNVSNKQQQQIGNCYVTYQCWIVHSDKSICLYLNNDSDAAAHSRLTLASMKVIDGIWSFVHKRINIFARLDQFPIFVALYETKEDDEETAEFVIGNKKQLSKVIIRFNGVSPSHRPIRVCAGDITDVTVTDHMIITCDDQTTRLVWRSDSLQSFDTDLTNALKSSFSESYVTDNGQAVMIATIEDETHVSLQLAYREIFKKCGDNFATFTDGVLVENSISGVNFFAILDGNLTVVNESCNGLQTIATNVCYSYDCYLLHTKHFLYVSDQNRTTVINPRTYEVIMIQYANIRDVLPVAERVLQQCEDESQVPVTPTEVTSTSTTVVSPIITSAGLPITQVNTTTSNYTVTSTDTGTVFIPPTTTSFTTSVPSTTTFISTGITRSTVQAASTNAVSTQSTNGTVNDTNATETHQNYIYAGVGIVVTIVLAVVILTITLAVCRKRRLLQPHHKNLQTSTQVVIKEHEDTIQVSDLNHSPVLGLRHPSRYGQATSGYIEKGDKLIAQNANPMVPQEYHLPIHTVQLRNTMQDCWEQNRRKPSSCKELIAT